jgi:acyl-CoA thioesterase FadM
MMTLPTEPYGCESDHDAARHKSHGNHFRRRAFELHRPSRGGGALSEIQRQDWPQRALVTVAMNAVEFHEPVFVGDVVSFWTRLMRLGTTSVAVHVSVETERQGQIVRLTEAEVVYVAIDPSGGDRRPRPIRPLETTDL